MDHCHRNARSYLLVLFHHIKRRVHLAIPLRVVVNDAAASVHVYNLTASLRVTRRQMLLQHVGDADLVGR